MRLLGQGELALLIDGGGLDTINALAHALGLVSMQVLRSEATPGAQERTVIEYAARMPLVWVANSFSEEARTWARERGPMTLLVQSAGAVPEPERHRIERFVASLGAPGGVAPPALAHGEAGVGVPAVGRPRASATTTRWSWSSTRAVVVSRPALPAAPAVPPSRPPSAREWTGARCAPRW